MFKKIRERRPSKPQSERTLTDALVPTPSRDGRKSSTGSILSDWTRRRSLTPNGARTPIFRSPQPSPSPSRRRSSPAPCPPLEAVGKLGLHVIYQPTSPPHCDIIFIHGLGGDSRKTWSKDPYGEDHFWPQHWLPLEPDMEKARILSFGYNASFLPGTPRNIYRIGDFAKELLYEMKFSKDDDGEDLDIGRVPVIFVLHSMGGLVAKKAYLLGQNDEAYQGIVRSIFAMVFLATPHRGTNLAETLNRLLAVLFQPSRDFITDLNKSSPALEEMNEQFRHVAPKLSIWSFYETVATTVGLMKLLVLDKDSSILGYTKEISRPLDADHHGMCKYSSPDDPNYIIVRNAISALIKNLPSNMQAAKSIQSTGEIKNFEKTLAISSSPEDDLESVRSWWIPGTCDWFLHEPAIQSWMGAKHESCITWFCAPPASGKSTLSAHIISHLRTSGVACQYFFFKFDDPKRRTLSAFMRSMAYQIARDIPDYKEDLAVFLTDEMSLEKTDYSIIWKNLFESMLFSKELSVPLYWVVDALDESESPKVLPLLLQSAVGSQAPLRILILSRKTQPLSLAFERLASSLPSIHIEKSGPEFNSHDIHALVQKEINYMRGGDELKHKVAHTIESLAQGSFLWARLVLEDIVNCHSEDAIQEVLDDIPSDMNNLYRRMELTMLNHSHKVNTALARALLQWTICSSRLLTLKELAQALKPEFPEMLDLKRTIQDVCGHFLVVDGAERVTIVHKTARDYLVKNPNNNNFINLEVAHTELFLKTLSVLCDQQLRVKLTYDHHLLLNTEPFLFYAATSWVHHLQNIGTASDTAMDKLVEFFKSIYVLSWIHALAIVNHLEVLVKAAKVLTNFISKRRKLNSTRNPLLHRLADIDLLEQWAVDLVKLVGKFSRPILANPTAIYKLIPPFSPEESMIHRQFRDLSSAEIAISGISNISWNDHLAKIALPNNDQAWNVLCAARNLVVLGSTGNVYIWDSANFQETCRLQHQEPVTTICLNNKGDKLVTCGLRNTKLWSVSSGQLISCVPNPGDVKAMSAVFAENDAKILIASDDRMIRYLLTECLEEGWHILNSNLLKENSKFEGAVINSPMYMSFNREGTQIGVSYRGYPLSVWSLTGGFCIGRCKRAKSFRGDNARPSTSWFAVDRFTWNPISGHVIGLYKDGCVFKWHPVTDTNQEAQSAADEIAASSDGKLFLTSDSDGTVRVWNFDYLTVIYQLSSSDLVTGLVFGPDGNRFYDIRGCSVSAWEPNSIIRFSELGEFTSDTTSEDHTTTMVSYTSHASLTQYEAITIVAGAPGSRLYCVGNEEGVVNLIDNRKKGATELLRFSNFLSVSQLAWSQDATHVATADLGGDIFLRELISLAGDGSMHQSKSLASPKVNLDGRGIHQLLFKSDSTLLLIASDSCGQIWSLKDETVIATLFDQDLNRRWLQHPTKQSAILAFGANDVRTFHWEDLSEEPRLNFMGEYSRLNILLKVDLPDDTTSLTQLSLNRENQKELKATVEKAIFTQDGKHVLLQRRCISSQSRVVRPMELFDISSFNQHKEEHDSMSIASVYVPPDILSTIDVALGVLSGSRLAFLNQELWFCTFDLNTSTSDPGEALKRHYFIPRDWVSTESVQQCCLMEDGSLLCPKDDKVAVIQFDLESTGF